MSSEKFVKKLENYISKNDMAHKVLCGPYPYDESDKDIVINCISQMFTDVTPAEILTLCDRLSAVTCLDDLKQIPKISIILGTDQSQAMFVAQSGKDGLVAEQLNTVKLAGGGRLGANKSNEQSN